MKWCVIIPTYNNDQTLEKVIQDVLRFTSDVIVVNDGSTDQTQKILEHFPQIKVIGYSINRGKGYALRKGFEKARQEGFEYAVTLDSDGQHFASDIYSFIDKATECPGAVIVGTRTLPQNKMRKGSGFANRFSNFWFRFITGVSLPDTQSGFRLYPLQVVQHTRFFSNRYEFELEILIRSAWKGFQLIDIPVNVFYPSKEERISHFRPIRDFVRISILNTICLVIALFVIKPFAFIHYLKKETVRGFLHKHVIQTGDSASKITLSVMFGVFMGVVPIWGYQLITAIAFAYLLRLNKFIVIVAANISIPPMIPIILYLSYITGGWVLSVKNDVVFSNDISLAWVRDNLYQYIVGSIIFAILLSITIGLITFVLLKLWQRRPKLLKE
jgi:glycosyltransferase involved in cell wall biosynthesis